MTYPLTWKITKHDPPLTREEVQKEPGAPGACHALLLASVMRGEKGGNSTMFVGVDGSLEEDLSHEERFKIWTILAKQLCDNLPPGWKQTIAQQSFEAVQKVILQNRKARPA